MTELSEYQFELGGVVFGRGCPVTIDGDGFDPGTDEPTAQDVFDGFTESVAFGEDKRTPALWVWAMHTDEARTSEDAIADERELALAWRNAVNVREAGTAAALRYNIGHRTRVVFGRPRRFAGGKPSSLIYGLVGIVADFQRADNLFYADQEESITVAAPPQENYGLMTPLISPITTLAGSPVFGVTPQVGGDVPAPFLATIEGPIVNPKLSTDSWELELLTSIPDGMSVTISTYPWGMRAVRSDGANLSGYFTAQSRLSKARLAVGGESIRLDGIDSSGTASATIRWRAAYTTI